MELKVNKYKQINRPKAKLISYKVNLNKDKVRLKINREI